MDIASEFQKKYPLSPRKFWKKFVTKLGVMCIVALVAAVLFGALIAVGMATAANGDFNVTTYFLAMVAVFFVAWGGGMALYSWYVRVYIRRYYYEAGPQFVTIQKGVITPREIHVQYQKIQDVYVDQDLFDRIFGIYDVHLASATVASGMEAHIDGVDKATAESLKNILLNSIQHGGISGTTPTMAAAATASATPAQPVKLAEEVSSRTFPLGKLWFAQVCINNIFVAAFGLFMFDYVIVGIGETSSVIGMLAPAYRWLIVVGTYALVYFALLVWWLAWKQNFFFELRPDFLALREGVISRSEKHVPYRTIQDVSFKQGVIERVLGIATVVIENASSNSTPNGKRNNNITIPGQPVAEARKIVEVLKNILTITRGAGQTGL